MDVSLLVSRLEAENKGKPIGNVQPVFTRVTTDKTLLVIILSTTVSGFNIKNHIEQMSGVILFYIISLGFT